METVHDASFDIKNFWICPPPPKGVQNFKTVRMTNIYALKQHQLNGVGSKGALLLCVFRTALDISTNSLRKANLMFFDRAS
jgi:hypothetical protein